MPNYYTSYSEAITHITADEERWLRQQLEEVCVFEDGAVFADDSECPDEYAEQESIWGGYRFFADEHDEDCWPFSYEWFAEGGSTGLALYHGEEESDGLESVGPFVSAFLKKFRPDEVWTLEWADRCDRPCIGTFGGGCLFVRADGFDHISTGEIERLPVDELLERIAKVRRPTVKDDLVPVSHADQ